MEPAFSIELAMEKYKNAEEVPVTCGGLTGLLLLKKFFCPAIHRACIRFNGEIVTPKQFCIMGDKQKLKDWKNAIRIEGFPLRKYIETGQLDFYRHSEFCTGRCTARTPLNRSSNISNIASEANATTVMEPVASVVPSGERITIADTLYQRFFPSAVENEDDGTISVKETAKQAEDRKLPQIKRESGVSTSLRSPASPIRLSAGNATKLQPGSSLSSSTLPAASSSTWRMKLAAAKVKTQPDKHHVFEIEDGIEVVTVSSTQLSDDQQFWLGIVEQNLCDLVFQEIHSALESMKQDLITYCVRDAYCLSNVVRELGLMGNLKDKLADIKHHMDLQQASIANEMLELKKKVAEFEAKKLALKRKSDKFNYLIEVTKAKKQRKMKVVPDVAESSLLGSSSSEGSDEEADEDQPPSKSAKHGVVEKEQTLRGDIPRSSEKSERNASKTSSSAAGSKKTLSSSSAKTGSVAAKGDVDVRAIRRSNTKNTSDDTSTFKTAATVNSAACAADVLRHRNASKERGDKSGCHKKQPDGKEESRGRVSTNKGIILENKTGEIDEGGKPVCLLKLEDLATETCTDKEVLEESAFERSEEHMVEGSTGADNSVEQQEIEQSGGPSAHFAEKGSTGALDCQKETNCVTDKS
ncbi:uncharacterized protein LOC112561879 isoform X2 [Pomacea canaliculata]|uniref:uncharacterized protein LOC112561879 isoform X2 n=1 Tax=Pomacea canaliculata TaxID=400727 RepID=UPI000D729741|nr:uncharacterized protein LOC112561879 isoform X2 [Pomacea canaliculata]